MDSVMETGHGRTAKWSREMKVAILIMLFCLILAVCFVGGYFVGRGTLTISKPIVINGNDSPKSTESTNWKDAVCLITETNCPLSFAKSPLILLSMDGFAAEYLKLHQTPALERLMHCGSSPPYMSPIFPTKTFPNHYSIATGLYPAYHGIVDNNIYDTVTEKIFSISTSESREKSWWQGEPIWVTAKKQGVKTATFFWPGSDVPGQIADYYVPYNRSTPFVERVEQVLRWLDEPEDKRPQFITIYFEEPDSSGHKHGPRSPETKDALRQVDGFVNLLMEGLYERDLIGCANLILLSDHGMETISCDRVISMHKMNPTFSSDEYYSRSGTVGRLRPLKTNHTDLKVIQDEFQCKSPHAWVYLEGDLPIRWHYSPSENPRIDPVLFDIDPQWLITDGKGDRNPKYCSGGDHGYDNLDEDMWAIFVGSGPAFKTNFVSEPFLNIEVYNLMTVLLNIRPAANNGTVGAISHLLRNPPADPEATSAERFVVCRRSNSDDGNSSGCFITPREEEISGGSFLNASAGLTRWGLPVDDTQPPHPGTCLLSNAHYVTGFSLQTKMPKWTSFEISDQVMLESEENPENVKWSNDPRLSDGIAPLCRRYDPFVSDNIVQVPLTPFGLSSDNGTHLISDAVPMYKGFYESLLPSLWSKFETWRLKFPNFSTVMGPAWANRTGMSTYDDDGIIPTHYFLVIMFCDSICRPEDLDVLSFILPHRNSIPNCWDMDKYLEKHQARVSDVEILTGLKFFSGLPKETSMKLRLKLLQTSALSLLCEMKSRRF